MKIKSFLFSLLLFTSVHSLEAADVKPVMHQNYQALMDLQKYAADPQRFEAKENYAEISALVSQLAGIADLLPEMMEKDRPGMAVIGKVYVDYLKSLETNLKKGPTPFLRNKIRTMTSFCFECHTTLSTSQNYKVVEKKIQNWNLTPLQKADFYAATRQFDKALKLYEFVLLEPVSQGGNVADVPAALKSVLSLAVRVKQDPALALKFLDIVSARVDLPPSLRDQITQWEKAAASWKKESPIAEDAEAKVWLEKALQLINRAKKIQSSPSDPSANISFLRSINYIHEALKRSLDSHLRTQAFAMLGTAYSALQDPLLWSLDTLYFEACIRESPHTALSQQCFSRYAQETYFNFTGSAGLDLPEDEAAKFKELRSLSQSKKN